MPEIFMSNKLEECNKWASLLESYNHLLNDQLTHGEAVGYWVFTLMPCFLIMVVSITLIVCSKNILTAAKLSVPQAVEMAASYVRLKSGG
ncbi:hypothetical protein QTO04_00825 [Vibrio parahaemolyticus]